MVRRLASRPWPRALLAALVTVGVAAVQAPAAAAYDSYPCGGQVSLPWTTEPVQPCPLTTPLPPNNWVPVYGAPIPNRRGATPPTPAGWLHGLEGKYFVCQRVFPQAVFYHPSAGWRNIWWALTRSDEGVWGWVPQVFFRGGANDESDFGLRACPDPPPPSAPPSPPPSTPPAAVDPCDASQRVDGLQLHASVGTAAGSRRRRRAIITRYRRKVRVQGQLTRSDGVPVANAPVCVVASRGRPLPNEETALTTDAAGRFTYVVPRGPSRRLLFVHRTSGGAAAAKVVVRVRAPVALGVSRRSLRNGQTVVFRGRLVRPRGGVLVELQVRRGRRWLSLLGTTRTRKRGRFRHSYRFTRTLGVRRYRFRARVPAQRGYPFTTGTSRPVVVRVRG